jgi:hypothetical protein
MEGPYNAKFIEKLDEGLHPLTYVEYYYCSFRHLIFNDESLGFLYLLFYIGISIIAFVTDLKLLYCIHLFDF